MQIEIEDDMMNKFQLANRENIKIIEKLDKSIRSEIISLKAAYMWDRVIVLLGFIAVSSAIYFGLYQP